MVAHGPALTEGTDGSARLDAIWARLDEHGEPVVLWARPVDGSRAVVLLGAFDPPTRAHVALLEAASKTEGVPPVLCMTKELLARSPDELLTSGQRLHLLDAIAAARSYGLALANRGTYIDVSRALRSSGIDATFVVGSDKVDQLADPSFYPDGRHGVDATFAEIDFLVVPRLGVDVGVNGLRVLEPDATFDEPAIATISSTEVRRRLRDGVDVTDLVPPEVAVDIEGYTAAR